jgi:hypothetical protein
VTADRGQGGDEDVGIVGSKRFSERLRVSVSIRLVAV